MRRTFFSRDEKHARGADEGVRPYTQSGLESELLQVRRADPSRRQAVFRIVVFDKVMLDARLL